MDRRKCVAAIHDISGLGKCSLSVILPVLSAMGVQVCPVPTAVLSAHTGYGDFVMRALTAFISDALEHYKKLGQHFDCVYSGFLASAEQIDHCLDFLSAYPQALKVVDPVMGDNGKPYRTFTDELCRKMSRLVKAADIITPNLHEAQILCGFDIRSESDMVRAADVIYNKYNVTVLLKGGHLANTSNDLLYDGNETWFEAVRIDNPNTHGTGCTLSSAIAANLAKDMDIKTAVKSAKDYITGALSDMLDLGKGSGPLNHMYKFYPNKK